jgi:hypothetical protein
MYPLPAPVGLNKSDTVADCQKKAHLAQARGTVENKVGDFPVPNLGEIGIVTSRLGKGKLLTFFYSVMVARVEALFQATL